MGAFHVRTFPLRDVERAWTESEADYFSRSLGLSAKYDRDSSSWRTSQRLLFAEPNELLENFAAYGMTVDGDFYPLKTWERITDEKGGGLWPTPRANKVGGYSSPGFRPTLEQTVKMWPTPNPGEHGRGGQNLSTEVGGQLNPMWVEWLMGYLSAWTALEDWAIVWFRLKRGKHLKG